MKPKELYDYITGQMTAEQALLTLLESSIVSYEKLKFESPEKSVHPVLIISMAAMDMGWQLAVKSNDEKVNGICVGTQEYVNSIFNQ